MRVKLLFVCFIAGLLGAKAQTNKLVAGTRLQITQVSKLTNAVNMMGTDMTTEINSTIYSTVEIKRINGDSIVVSSTTTRITGNVKALGQDNSYDSNDSSSVNNPLVASQLKDINQSKTFTIINGKAKAENAKEASTDQSLAKMVDAGEESIVEGLFVPSEINNKSEGFKWTSDDKSEDGTQQQTTLFALTKLTPATSEVTANTTMTVKGKIKMMGMDVNQNLSGSRTSTSTYQKATGLLSATTQNIAMTGTEEVMGNSIPISLKGVITTTVQ